MDLQELINNKKEENVTKKELWAAGLITSAYASLLTIKTVRKWVNDSKNQQTFSNKVSRLNQKIIIPRSILNIPKNFNIPNLINMVIGSPKETNYNNLLNSITIGSNTESYNIVKNRNDIYNNLQHITEKINTFNVDLQTNKTLNITGGLSFLYHQYKNELKTRNSLNDINNQLIDLNLKWKNINNARKNINPVINSLQQELNYYIKPFNIIDEYTKLLRNQQPFIEKLHSKGLLRKELSLDQINELSEKGKKQYYKFLNERNKLNSINRQYYNKYIKGRDVLVWNIFNNQTVQQIYHESYPKTDLFVINKHNKIEINREIFHNYISYIESNRIRNVLYNENESIILPLQNRIKQYNILKAGLSKGLETIHNKEIETRYNLSNTINSLRLLTKQQNRELILDNNIIDIANIKYLSKNFFRNKDYINKIINIRKYEKSFKALINEYTTVNLDQYKNINRDNIDELRNAKNTLKHNQQILYVFNKVLKHLRNKSIGYIEDPKRKGYFSFIEHMSNLHSRIDILNDYVTSHSLDKYFNSDGTIKKLLQTENRANQYVESPTFTFDKNTNYSNTLQKVNNFVAQYIDDTSPDQYLTKQLNEHKQRIIDRGVLSGLNKNKFTNLVNHVFRGFSPEARRSNLNFVSDLIELTLKQDAVKKLAVETKVIDNLLMMTFNITSNADISFNVDIPVPSFTGLTRNGLSTPFVVNQYEYMTEFKSIYQGWLDSYVNKLKYDYSNYKEAQQDIYQKTQKSIKKFITQLNAYGISSENPIQDLINGFTVKGDISAIIEKLPPETRKLLEKNFNLVKRFQGKNSLYKKVFIDLEFNSDINPLDKKGITNDISEFAIMMFDNEGKIQYVDNYLNEGYISGKFQKQTNYKLEDKLPENMKKLLGNNAKTTRFASQRAMIKQFLKRFSLNEIDNLIFISKANTMKGGDLDRLIGMLREYTPDTLLERDKIDKLLPRLNQQINYINFQDFMVYNDLSLDHRINLGSKKGEVLEKEIYETYYRAKKNNNISKYRFIEKITKERDPELYHKIKRAYSGEDKLFISTYKHQAINDTITMSIYFDIIEHDMKPYTTYEEYRKANEIDIQSLNAIWSQNLANSQNIWRGNIHPFDLRTLVGQNELHLRNKLRHYFNAERFTVSLDSEKYISDPYLTNNRRMRILSESEAKFAYMRDGELRFFKEHLYGANVFNAIRPTAGLWEGSIMYNANTIGQTYIPNKRRETIVLKIKEGLKVGDIIQPEHLLDIDDFNSSFIGEKSTGEIYINYTNRPKQVVSITPNKDGTCVVVLEELVRMSSGQKVTVNGSSGLLNEGVNSIYDLMMHSKNFSTGNKKAIIDQMLGRVVELIENKRQYILQNTEQDELLRQQLLKIGIIKEVTFSKSDNLVNIITKDLYDRLSDDHKELDKAISEIGQFLKNNFSIAKYMSKSNNTMRINISNTQKSLKFEDMNIREWGTRIANDVFKMTLEGDMENEKIIKNLLLNITDAKYHKQIDNLFGVQNYYYVKSNVGKYKIKTNAAKERLDLLRNIFTDSTTGYLFSLMGLESNGIKSFITGVSGINAAGLLYDEMQGSHNTKSLIIGPLFNILAKMNAASQETLDVYKHHIENGVESRLGFNIRNAINTDKNIQKEVQHMVNLNKLFETNKSFTDFISTVLNDSISHDNALYGLDHQTIIGYAPQDSKVVKNLDKDQLNVLRYLYEQVENKDIKHPTKKGAYYQKNGKKYFITADELLVRNTENPNQYLISRQFYNLIKLYNDKNYRVENAISEEFSMLSFLRANELSKGVVPGQNIAITSGKEITTNSYEYYLAKHGNNIDKAMIEYRSNFELGKSLFFGEQILKTKSLYDIPGFDSYIKNMKLNDMKRDILYLIDYDKYKESVENIDNKTYNIDFLQQYKNKRDVARLNNLRWEIIYEAEKTGTGVYAKATKKFAEKHKQNFSDFLLDVLNTTDVNSKKLKSFREKMSTAIELEMIAIRQNNVKNPAGSSSVYENNRVFVHTDKTTDRPMLIASNIVVALSKKDFDGDTINAILALSADPTSPDAYRYFDRDYLRSRKRIDILKRNGLLKDNDLNLEVIENSRVFSFTKDITIDKNDPNIDFEKIMDNNVKSKLTKLQSSSISKNNENNAIVKYTKKYAADAYKRGFIGQLTLTNIKYGVNKDRLLESESVQELFDALVSPIVESPLAMNKYATDVPKAFELLNKSQTVHGRKELRRYLESNDPLIRANFDTFNKFLNNRFKKITVDGTSTGEIYNKGAVELMQTNFGASFDEQGYAYLKPGDKYFEELSQDVLTDIKIGNNKIIQGKYITSLDFTRGLLPKLAYEEGVNQTIQRQYNMILGHSSVKSVSDYFAKFGINPFDVNNSSLIQAIIKDKEPNKLWSKISLSSKKFINKNKKAGVAVLGGALVASFIAGNTLGETPGEYISNDLFYGSHDNEAQYSELMNQAIYSPSLNTKLHLATPMYQQKFDYAGYSSKLIQSYNPNPIQTQQVRTMPLIFN
ncbi:MAG: hypothetical protein IJ880_00370 [Bacilli bacterium]|nr:hypothetical protein [Bacilli bacterium]